MNKTQLKKLIKPVVKECIQEVLIEEGLLTEVVAQVASGMSRQPIVENKPKKRNDKLFNEDLQMQRKSREANKNYEKLVKENRALGELDHPDDSVINLKNASHMVTAIWMEDKAVMGKVKVLNTPSGQVLKSLVESGVKLGISSRGMGSVSEGAGKVVVQEDFQLICFDFVSEPSTPNAFMMREAKEYNNKVFTKADRINRLLNEVLKDE